MYPRVKTSAETHWIKSWLTVLEPTEERTPLPVTSVPLMELLARMELLYVVFHLPCLASAKREDDAALPRPGERSGAGVIVQPSDLLSPKPSQIHPRFCVPNSNRCQSGVLTTPARICKNESAHIRNYE